MKCLELHWQMGGDVGSPFYVVFDERSSLVFWDSQIGTEMQIDGRPVGFAHEKAEDILRMLGIRQLEAIENGR